jgi:hypothetical protein
MRRAAALEEDGRMRKLLVLAAAAATLAAPAAAGAKPRFKTVKSTGVIKGHLAQPATPEGFAFAGFLSDAKHGEGAFTSQGSFSGATASGGLIAFFDHGTVRGSFTFTATAPPGGSVTYTGTTKLKGGTGRYRGAKGSGRVTGTQDADGYTTLDYTQTLKIPRR